MKKHKVDPENLPTGEVIAINFAKEISVGVLSIKMYGKHGDSVVCTSGTVNLWGITHYITKEDILNAREHE
jgi:hypothetical protein